MDFPGFDGFLGNRASFMLDVVFMAMFIIVPLMAWSIYQVKPIPPAPEKYVRSHRSWATLAALDMGATAVTGCTFYVLAFMA